jgi:hypothetical protein
MVTLNVYIGLTFPDDRGVKLRLDGSRDDWERAVYVVLEIVNAHAVDE